MPKPLSTFWLLYLVYLGGNLATAQPADPGYTAWIAGDTADTATQPQGGVLLAGGGTDVDAAMRWFLRRAGGGDVLILRASGSNGYNKYLYETLGESVNSVETILLNSRELASHPAIIRKIRGAEAIFLAGGDQGNYVKFWQGTPVAVALNERIRQGAVAGGTSAGCGILGQLYFTALEGTITSDEALADPYDRRMSLRRNDFLEQPLLTNTITDMHYVARNRQGRHLAMMARAIADWGGRPRGIGVDEKTAVCVTPDGDVAVFGQGHAYFLQSMRRKPERCQPQQPLTWQADEKAVRVITIAGSVTGTGGLNLRTYRADGNTPITHWWVSNGVFSQR